MKAWIRDRYGPIDVLELADVEMPMVADDGVRVRVQASSVNQADLDYLYGRPAIARLGTGCACRRTGAWDWMWRGRWRPSARP